ncbi:MAG: universal stress protein [Gammaproteobacteria bacterium]
MKRFRNILCVVQPHDAYKPVLERAVALAQSNQASLSVVTVHSPISLETDLSQDTFSSTELADNAIKAYALELDKLVKPYRDGLAITTKILTGTPFLEIIREVMRSGHDLVLASPEPQDWFDRLFSSDDMHLLRKCPCPLWFVKTDETRSYRRILAAVDVADNYPPEELQARHALNRSILEMASSLALAELAELHIVHAWEAFGESAMRGVFLRTSEDKLDAYVEQVRQQHAVRLDSLLEEMATALGAEAMDYLKPQHHLIKGRPRREIPVLVKSLAADLLVMGTVARTGIPGFIMGNTAETILNQIDCSVLALKPPGFITPVTLPE